MARYKSHDTAQGKLIPVSFEAQLPRGTFEHALSHVIDHKLDLSVFEARYCNDDGGAPAYHSAVLLKIILFAYSKGMTSSREIQWCCQFKLLVSKNTSLTGLPANVRLIP